MNTLTCTCCGMELPLPEADECVVCPACGTQNRPVSQSPAADPVQECISCGQLLHLDAGQQTCVCPVCGMLQSCKSAVRMPPTRIDRDDYQALWTLALSRHGVELVLDAEGHTVPRLTREPEHFLQCDPVYRRALKLCPADFALEAKRIASEVDAALMRRKISEIASEMSSGRDDACDVYISCELPDHVCGSSDYAFALKLRDALKTRGYHPCLVTPAVSGAAEPNFRALNAAGTLLWLAARPWTLTEERVQRECQHMLRRIDAGEDCRLLPVLMPGMAAWMLPDAITRYCLPAVKLEDRVDQVGAVLQAMKK